MKLYKGFDKDLRCRNFQYKEGETYEEKHAILCKSGFHACENPMDCFNYYAPGTSRYHEVELDVAAGEASDDTKRVGKKITIGAEIGLRGVIEGAIKFVFAKTEWKEENSTTGIMAGAQATGSRAGAQATGYQAGAQATGYQAGAQATGTMAGAQATGDRAGAQATGYQAGAQATGDQAGAQATGYQAGAQATGYQAGAQATGIMAGAQATGDRAGAQATGYQAGAQATGIMAGAQAVGRESTAFADGAHAVACAIGKDTRAKGSLGAWLVVVERDEWDGECYPIITVKAAKVDGVSIKENTFYKLENGTFIEA